MKTNHQIIIICPNIPPNKGIGGRRWAKFSKYLDKAGYQVHLIGFNGVNKQNSANWLKDIESIKKKGNLHLINSNYPNILQKQITTFFDKVIYKISLEVYKLIIKGQFYDSSSLWINTLKKKLIQLNFEDNIVIASGAPFSYLYDLAKLKKHYNFKLILDFRDPWTDNKIGYGYKELNKKRLQFEIEKEKYALNKADINLFVYQEQINTANKIVKDKNKNILLPNGFDPEEKLNFAPVKRKEKIRLIFGGTLYNNTEYVFKEFIESINSLENDKIEKLTFDFYGKFPSFIKQYKINHKIDIKFNSPITLEDMYREISMSDIVMIFLTDEMNYTYNTKILEALNSNKKIMVFSSKGKIIDDLNKYNLGYDCSSIENIKNSFEQIIKDHQTNNLKLDTNFNLDNFSIKNLTKIIENNL